MATTLIERLAACFEKLPGVGRKSAERFAYHVLTMSAKDIKIWAEILLSSKECLRACDICGVFGEDISCAFCSDESRDKGLLCVVERPSSAALIERTGRYKGLYHVLGASLVRSPQAGRAQARVKSLLARAEKHKPREVFLALPPSAEGETTAALLAKMLKPLSLRVTRLGIGIPVGGELDYADEATLASALEGRKDI